MHEHALNASSHTELMMPCVVAGGMCAAMQPWVCMPRMLSHGAMQPWVCMPACALAQASMHAQPHWGQVVCSLHAHARMHTTCAQPCMRAHTRVAHGLRRSTCCCCLQVCRSSGWRQLPHLFTCLMQTRAARVSDAGVVAYRIQCPEASAGQLQPHLASLTCTRLRACLPRNRRAGSRRVRACNFCAAACPRYGA